jgi:hypothetical protein
LFSDENASRLFKMLSSLPYQQTKHIFCSTDDLIQVIDKSITLSEKLSPQQWLYLEFLQTHCQAEFLKLITTSDFSILDPSSEFTAINLNLPADYIKLNNFQLTSLPCDKLFAMMTCSFGLCTFYRKKEIEAHYAKMFLFDKQNQYLGVVAIYDTFNAYAVMGIGNKPLNQEIKDEILNYFTSQGMLQTNPIAVESRELYNFINQRSFAYDGFVELESHLENFPSLAEKVYPEIRDRIKELKINPD